MARIMVVKLGGKSLEGEAGYSSLGRAIKALTDVQVVVVHGGGAEISDALRAANREPVFVDGLRVTTPDDMAIVERVLSQEINVRIADILQRTGLAVCRLSGKSESLFIVKKWLRDGRDLGCVGEIVRVHPEVVRRALDRCEVPVISPISADANGQTYNVNADTAAGAMAGALDCSDLIYFTDVPGVRVGDHVASTLTTDEAQRAIELKVIHGGMVAKVESAFSAITAGVPRVHISAWQGDDTLLRIASGEYDFGTAVIKAD
jgi:acetylglutamate kinase